MNMMSQPILFGTRVLRAGVSRNIVNTAPALNKAADPIQQLFLEKIREYNVKACGDEMFEPSPEIERELKQSLERIERHYGCGGKTDITKFPEFTFPDAKIDPINN